MRVSQGGRTTVLDYRRTAGLDLLAIVAEHVDPVDGLTPLLRSALEMRAGIAVDLARLCAERGGRTLGAELLEIASQLAQTSEARSCSSWISASGRRSSTAPGTSPTSSRSTA